MLLLSRDKLQAPVSNENVTESCLLGEGGDANDGTNPAIHIRSVSKAAMREGRLRSCLAQLCTIKQAFVS